MSQSETNKIIGLKRQLAHLKKRLANGVPRERTPEAGSKLSIALEYARNYEYRAGQEFMYAHADGSTLRWRVIEHPYPVRPGDIYLVNVPREAGQRAPAETPATPRFTFRIPQATAHTRRRVGEVADAPDTNDAGLIPAAAYRHIPDPRDIDGDLAEMDLADDAGR